MARIKTKEQVIEQIKYAQKAIKDKNLKGLAESIAANPKHPLYKALNSYPALPFEISADDLKVIEILKTFPSPLPDNHQWTPLEKIFYALLWKDGKLESIKRIIEGAEHALSNTPSTPSSAVVYHYFGRHLTDRLRQPIIDQHTIRAFRLLTTPSEDKLDEIRAIQSLTNDDAQAYCTWYVEMTTAEGIESYEDSRKIDCFLFALGKYAKKAKKKG